MKRYNALNDIKTDPYEIGICPTCSIRLTHGCEHSQTQLAQEWLAAVIVAEQGFDIEILDAQPTPAAAPTLRRTIHMDGTYPNPFIRGGDVYDMTPNESDMPEIDFDGVEEVGF